MKITANGLTTTFTGHDYNGPTVVEVECECGDEFESIRHGPFWAFASCGCHSSVAIMRACDEAVDNWEPSDADRDHAYYGGA